MTGERLGRERLERAVQRLAQVRLDPLARAHDRKTGAQAGDAVRRGQRDDEADVAGHRRAVLLQRIDRLLDGPRDREREGRGRQQGHRTRRIARAVACRVAREGARWPRQPRLPAACGFSAA